MKAGNPPVRRTTLFLLIVLQQQEWVIHQVLLLEATWQFRLCSGIPGPGWSDTQACPGRFLQGCHKRMTMSVIWVHRPTGERSKQGL
jgi:hypothetical protein